MRDIGDLAVVARVLAGVGFAVDVRAERGHGGEDFVDKVNAVQVADRLGRVADLDVVLG